MLPYKYCRTCDDLQGQHTSIDWLSTICPDVDLLISSAEMHMAFSPSTTDTSIHQLNKAIDKPREFLLIQILRNHVTNGEKPLGGGTLG